MLYQDNHGSTIVTFLAHNSFVTNFINGFIWTPEKLSRYSRPYGN